MYNSDFFVDALGIKTSAGQRYVEHSLSIPAQDVPAKLAMCRYPKSHFEDIHQPLYLLAAIHSIVEPQPKAMNILRKAVEHGSPEATLFYAFVLEHGFMVKRGQQTEHLIYPKLAVQNYKKILPLYRKASRDVLPILLGMERLTTQDEAAHEAKQALANLPISEKTMLAQYHVQQHRYDQALGWCQQVVGQMQQKSEITQIAKALEEIAKQKNWKAEALLQQYAMTEGAAKQIFAVSYRRVLQHKGQHQNAALFGQADQQASTLTQKVINALPLWLRRQNRD